VKPTARDLALVSFLVVVMWADFDCQTVLLEAVHTVDVESCRQSTLSPVLIFRSSVARHTFFDSANGSQCEGRPCETHGARFGFGIFFGRGHVGRF
jgi:hypothetical protein